MPITDDRKQCRASQTAASSRKKVFVIRLTYLRKTPCNAATQISDASRLWAKTA